jgi:hypothetical protein
MAWQLIVFQSLQGTNVSFVENAPTVQTDFSCNAYLSDSAIAAELHKSSCAGPGSTRSRPVENVRCSRGDDLPRFGADHRDARMRSSRAALVLRPTSG